MHNASEQLLQRVRHTELQTNLPRSGILNLSMTRYRGRFVVCCAVVNGVFAPLTQEFTTVLFKVSREVGSFQNELPLDGVDQTSTVMDSRMTE